MEAMGGGDGRVRSPSSGASPGHVGARDGGVWPLPRRECRMDGKVVCPCSASVPRVRAGRSRRDEGRAVSMAREQATVLGMYSRSLERSATYADAMCTCMGSVGPYSSIGKKGVYGPIRYAFGIVPNKECVQSVRVVQPVPVYIECR
jgi:hypothetical protein